ncbi:MAG: flagellar basal body rod protein FlgC [Alphaproteobacteria bacterium]|nr:flagellar basal body rod protein FlgC [Alphaproteobacteria bacterium]
MDLGKALLVSASGMRAQDARLRVIAENLANTQSTGAEPGSDPYRRKLVTFKNEFDRALGLDRIKVNRVTADRTPFSRQYDPSHPAADAGGYVLFPNVKPMIELADMREAQRTYEANLNVIGATRSLLQRTIDLLRA